MPEENADRIPGKGLLKRKRKKKSVKPVYEEEKI
jgi:hypothetical protein